MSRLPALILAAALAAAAARGVALEEADFKDGPIAMRYAVEAPKNAAPATTTDCAKQLGLILCFHEHGGHAPDEAKRVVAALQRLQWSDGYVVIGCEAGTGHGYAVPEDHDRVTHLIAWAAKTWPINPRRVLCFGRGEGARMAGEYAANHPTLVAGAIAYAWGFDNLPETKDPEATAPGIYLVLGQKDAPNHLQMCRDSYARAKARGYPIVYREIPDLEGGTIDPATEEDALRWGARLRTKGMALSPDEIARLRPVAASARSAVPTEATVKALALVGGPEAGTIVEHLLDGKGDGARIKAAEAIGEGWFGEAAVAAVAKRAKDKSAAVRKAVLTAMGVAANWRSAAAQECLIAVAKDAKASLADRETAVEGIAGAVQRQIRGSYQDPPLFQALVDLLDDDSAELRAGAATVLKPAAVAEIDPSLAKPQRKAALAPWRAWAEQLAAKQAAIGAPTAKR